MTRVFAPFRFLYKVYFGIVYFLIGIVLFPFMITMIRGKHKYRNALALKKIWSKSLCTLTLLRVKVIDLENFPDKGPYIVCANHSSYLDIVIMFLVIPHDFAFLGKAEILKYPIINMFFKRGIDIPVYRNSVKRAKECIDLAEKAISEGRSIAIFPEGGIINVEHHVMRFKNGAFKLALDTKTPIVPISFVNNYKLFSDHEDVFGAGKPGIARVVIHKPIPTKELNHKDLVPLRDQTRDIIRKPIEENAN